MTDKQVMQQALDTPTQVDWQLAGKLMEVHYAQRAAGNSTGTSNWGAALARVAVEHFAEQPVQPATLTSNQMADVTQYLEPWGCLAHPGVAQLVAWAIAQPVQPATPVAYQGPKKWAKEEVENGNTGIRWVTETYVAGRPTSHDVMNYLLQRGLNAFCDCDKCKAFFRPTAVAQAELTAELNKVRVLREAGSELSNCAFNLSQAAGKVLSEGSAKTLGLAYKKWDAALAAIAKDST